MTEHILLWSAFVVAAAAITAAGTVLSRQGNVIAVHSGLGGTWVGVVLIASVTSLPELATGVSAVTVAGTPDIAVGDALGSCVFNLLIIVVLDFVARGESVYTRASRGHVLSAAFGIVLLGVVAFNLPLPGVKPPPSLFHVGVYTPILIAGYLLSMRTVFRFEKQVALEATGPEPPFRDRAKLRGALWRFGIAAMVVVVAGASLPFIGERLATLMHLKQTFVGTLFVALATSLPEVVVTVSALRIGAVDMAIADLFGSNLFDLLILAIDDLLFFKGPILSDVSVGHRLTVVTAIMMTGIAIVGLLYRPKKRVLKTVGWVSLFLLVLYVLNAYVLTLAGEG